MDFIVKILPYCYVRADLQGGVEGVTKFSDELQKDSFFNELIQMRDMGKITGVYASVTGVFEGGRCGVIGVNENVGGRQFTKTRGYFQSKFNPNEWIEVKFTNPR